MTNPTWKEVLPAPPAGCELREAWMTSFEPPDARLLVEDLLPALFGMNRSLSQDRNEKTLFFGELGNYLGRVPLTVISSMPRGAGEDRPYPWLWQYVKRCYVGSQTHAVQHAKLWAFHWGKGKEEWLELHVSSTNLTGSAFKNQLQAGWTVALELGNAGVGEQSWGALIPFLRALGTSAGTDATDRLIKLLGRATCPDGVTFIAGFPGQARGDRAARQLEERFKPSQIHILAPTIGDWNGKDLKMWSEAIGVPLGKVHLKWISQSHPWAESGGWALTESAKKNLERGGVQIECLPEEGEQFTPEYHDANKRWSHAKLYLMRSGRKRRRLLLVTSANWTASAWGTEERAPSNFELGVAIESEWTALEDIGERFPSGTAVFCIDRLDKEEGESALQWAAASWDGKYIALQARSTDGETPISVSVIGMDDARERAEFAKAATEATLPWSDVQRVPLTARFVQGNGAPLEVDVFDTRPLAERLRMPLPEVDPEQAQKLRDQFLLERYGGPAVDVDSIHQDVERQPAEKGGAASAADYTVKAWADARAAFGVVDQWRKAFNDASDPLQIERVRLDGEALRALYQRLGDVASKLAAEELCWRLEVIGK